MADKRKIVIIAGAGATRSDAGDLFIHKRPPLDKGFFREAAKFGGYPEIAAIDGYMKETYDVDILEDGDNLEQVMGTIYSDTVMPAEKERANPAKRVFFSLFGMFSQRIADTTNNLAGDNYRRILGGYLREGQTPDGITVVTFNQDLQIEKAVNALQESAATSGAGGVRFNFPYCYKLPPATKITTPTPKIETFNIGDKNAGGIDILKLHGSLNWFSKHTSPDPGLRNSLLKPERPLLVTLQKRIAKFTFKRKKTLYTLPVIVPPVGHKAGILHTAFADIWRNARLALREADEVVIFGYSCPEQDKESENLIRGSFLQNKRLQQFSVIDPAPAAIKRYADLTDGTKHKCLHFYRDADAFIGARFPARAQQEK